ncbi:MAG: phosphate signaling complex protein PhoU [Alphaproteobacteria bacterium]
MSDHIVKAFDAKLEELQTLTTRMGGLAESQLKAAMDAIVKRDSALAEKTIADDAKVDDLGAEIEARAVRLLALRQPVADDLRLVIAAIKITPDLERIGDLAKNLAKRALVLNRAEPMRITQGLAAMGRQALSQLAQVLNAYSSRDSAAAREVRQKDGAIDEMYNSLFRELLTYMMEDPRTIGLCTHLLFVAKNLERIGDHATNIAESIIFAIEGRYLTEERPKSDMTSTLDIKG